ncbi:uncharacterized protein LOC134265336 [Saccostrea cucullata]|uniref:uncharacterized protein LOC134265336 n=1 Tax=Saccostrea cuccullata TaxID=36930 RepID=UPI002ED50093
MFHYLNTSCPYANWMQTATKLCADSNRYHCLNNEIGQSGWICVDYILVERGRCLEFNSVAKKLDTIPCVGKHCPDTFYKSNDLHLYLGCRRERDEKTTSTNSLGLTTEVSALGASEVIGITVGVIIAIAISIIAVAVLCFISRMRQQNKNSKNPEEEIAMLATPEPDDERSFSRAQRALRTERFVVITGIQGAGKTFIAKRLCNELFKEEKYVWITDPNAFTVLSNFESPFVLDDLFHELQPEDTVREIREKIDSLYENVVAKQKY